MYCGHGVAGSGQSMDKLGSIPPGRVWCQFEGSGGAEDMVGMGGGIRTKSFE